MSKDKLSLYDWSMAAEGYTTNAMRAEQNAAMGRIVSNPYTNACARGAIESSMEARLVTKNPTHIGVAGAYGCAKGVSNEGCTLMKAQIKYDNPFLNDHSLLDVFNQGGMDAVDIVLGSPGLIGSSNGNDSDFS
jgi:hypothetical protein